MKFFYDEEYAQAKNYFTRSVEPNSNNLAKICDLFEQEGKYDEKGDELFHIGEYKLAQTYYEKAYNFEKYAIMYLYMKTNKLSSNIGLKIKNVNQLLGDINKKMNGR